MTHTTPETWHRSVCPYCGVGCGVDVGVRDGRVVDVRGTEEHPVNRGDLCALGRNLAEILETDDRYLAVGDSGTIIHPRSYGGQILGRSILGMGHALAQKTVYDQHYW